MTTFVPQKLAYLAASRSARIDLVYRLHAIASENVYCIDRPLRATREMALRDRATFEGFFGEPMPVHMASAVDVEIIGWERLEESFATFRESEANERDLLAYTRTVQEYLSRQLDLLRMEEEMVTSCLVQHYQEMTKVLWDAASKVKL